MNSTLKPPVSSQGQPSPATQLNKQMHPQGTPTYGQPSGHISQTPYPNINVAHNPQNHFSLNVPTATPHYNMGGSIPSSNHPVASQNQSSAGTAQPGPTKAVYTGSYQPNLGHPPNNPPVQTPTIPSQSPSNASGAVEPSSERPQSNGTTEEKPDGQENHMLSEKAEKSCTEAPPGDKPQERPKPPADQPDQPVEPTTQPSAVQETDPLAIDQPTETGSQSPVKSVDSGNQESDRTDSSEVEDGPKDDEGEEMEEDDEGVKEGGGEKVVAKKDSPKSSTRIQRKRTPKPEEAPPIPKPSKGEQKALQKSPGSLKTKRQRTRTQPYQAPLPEIEIITKITSTTPRTRGNDDKLIYFYKNEFLAVRNADGGFYLCQAVQNIYKSSSKIKIRWLSQDKNDKSGEIYTPDFYDQTDFDCILTSLDLNRVDKGKYRLTKEEKERTDSILQRCLAVEKGEIVSPSVSEEHPDGLDLSLYKDEEQLKKKPQGTKRKSRSRSSRSKATTTQSPEAPKARKVVVKGGRRAAAPPPPPQPRRPVPAARPKRAAPTSSGAGRAAKGAKRKVETKTSPVVDQKKAKVLAKIGKKAAVAAAAKVATRGGKPARSAPSTSKAKPTPIAKAMTTRKATKRSSGK